MCKHTKSSHKRIDKCMVEIVNFINKSTPFKTVACCCGHKKYNPSLLVRHPTYSKRFALDIFSHKLILRSKKFYIKDKQGYYFIPEVSHEIQR